MAICVAHFDGSPSITGWYWGCLCAECGGEEFFGPYKTARRAEKAGLAGDGSAAPLCLKGRLDPENPRTTGRVSARTAELAHKVRLENAETKGAPH
jgi:hypothetical protein